MKKEYNIPEMEIIIFKYTDVVTTSGDGETVTDTVEPTDWWTE